MLAAGLILPSNDEWESLIVLVEKKYGSLRFCVEYSNLKEMRTGDAYQIPRIDECIDYLGDEKILKTLESK